MTALWLPLLIKPIKKRSLLYQIILVCASVHGVTLVPMVWLYPGKLARFNSYHQVQSGSCWKSERRVNTFNRYRIATTLANPVSERAHCIINIRRVSADYTPKGLVRVGWLSCVQSAAV